MKLYTVTDDAVVVLVTPDRIQALEKLLELTKKYEKEQSWFWLHEEEI